MSHRLMSKGLPRTDGEERPVFAHNEACLLTMAGTNTSSHFAGSQSTSRHMLATRPAAGTPVSPKPATTRWRHTVTQVHHKISDNWAKRRSREQARNKSTFVFSTSLPSLCYHLFAGSWLPGSSSYHHIDDAEAAPPLLESSSANDILRTLVNEREERQQRPLFKLVRSKHVEVNSLNFSHESPFRTLRARDLSGLDAENMVSAARRYPRSRMHCAWRRRGPSKVERGLRVVRPFHYVQTVGSKMSGPSIPMSHPERSR